MLRKPNSRRVVVLCAHPDDEVLGCGGWIANLADEGHTVSVIFTTDGVRHPPVSTDSRPDSYKALQVLGVEKRNIHYLGIPTQRSDEKILRDFTAKIEDLTPETDVAILPYDGDLNIDHVFAHQLGLICFRPLRYKTSVVMMEILSASEFSACPFQPNFYVDISRNLERKAESLACYTRQVLPFPHPRSPEATCIKAKSRGLEVGWEAAEAFRIVRCF